MNEQLDPIPSTLIISAYDRHESAQFLDGNVDGMLVTRNFPKPDVGAFFQVRRFRPASSLVDQAVPI